MNNFNLDPDNILLPAKGRLLIASPFMDDPYFGRTVVLLCEVNDDGAFGFILNRYIELDLPDLIKNLPKSHGRISLGGPVENNSLYYIHKLGLTVPESQQVEGEIYLGGDFELITDKIEAGIIAKDAVRFFVGYSGWGEGQLDEEIEQRSWFVSDIGDLELMPTDRDDLWNDALKSMGLPYANLAHFPTDPKLN